MSSPLDEDIAETRRGVRTVKLVDPSILVEREVGYVGSGSEIHEKRPDNIRLTEPAEAKVDLSSPSVGTTHGMLASMIRSIAPYKLLPDAVDEVQAVVAERLRLSLTVAFARRMQAIRQSVAASAPRPLPPLFQAPWRCKCSRTIGGGAACISSTSPSLD